MKACYLWKTNTPFLIGWKGGVVWTVFLSVSTILSLIVALWSLQSSYFTQWFVSQLIFVIMRSPTWLPWFVLVVTNQMFSNQTQLNSSCETDFDWLWQSKISNSPNHLYNLRLTLQLYIKIRAMLHFILDIKSIFIHNKINNN